MRSPLQDPGHDRSKAWHHDRDLNATVREGGYPLRRMPLARRYEVRLLGAELDDHLVRSRCVREVRPERADQHIADARVVWDLERMALQVLGLHEAFDRKDAEPCTA